MILQYFVLIVIEISLSYFLIMLHFAIVRTLTIRRKVKKKSTKSKRFSVMRKIRFKFKCFVINTMATSYDNDIITENKILKSEILPIRPHFQMLEMQTYFLNPYVYTTIYFNILVGCFRLFKYSHKV